MELEKLSADYYGIGVDDPEKVIDQFAEMIAIREFREKAELGTDPKTDLKARVEELKHDPTVAKMAEKLPADEDFRRILKRGGGGGDAIQKAYVNGGELPEELCGMTVDELYTEHREAVQLLSGIIPSRVDYSPEKATVLLANLITLRELELRSGGDMKVDYVAFNQRAGELKRDPHIRNLAERLVLPQGQKELIKLVSSADAPERLLAQDLQKGYQQIVQPGKPAPEIQKEPDAEVKQAGVIRQEGPIISGP